MTVTSAALNCAYKTQFPLCGGAPEDVVRSEQPHLVSQGFVDEVTASHKTCKLTLLDCLSDFPLNFLLYIHESLSMARAGLTMLSQSPWPFPTALMFGVLEDTHLAP
jgi:hypothetical protein